MATSFTRSGGLITLSTRLTVADFDDNITRTQAAQFGGLFTFTQASSFNVELGVQDIKISVYRRDDINDRGVPTASPYFGTVINDSYRNRHGPITTDTLNLGFRPMGRHSQASITSRSSQVTAFTTILSTGSGGIRINVSAPQSGGMYIPPGFFSELLCAGRWVLRYRLRLRANYTAVATAGTFTGSFFSSVTEVVSIGIPADVACPGTGDTPEAPTGPTAPEAPTDPSGGGPVAPPPTGGGGGSAPPPVVVTATKPVVEWNDSALFRAFRSPTDGRLVTYHQQVYADEFKPLRLAWDYFSAQNVPQGSFRVSRTVRGGGGGTISALGAWLQRMTGGGFVFNTTVSGDATYISGEDRFAILPANTSGTNIAVGQPSAGWASTRPDNEGGAAGQGYSRTEFGVGVRDNATTPRVSDFKTLIVRSYQGLRLSAITEYDAGTNNEGFEINYYAAGVTTNTRARNNDVFAWKWAIYRRGAPEDEQPLAGTVRDQEQTFEASGAHFVETGWYPGYRLDPRDNTVDGIAVTQQPNFNPDGGGTRLRINFDGLTTGNTKGLLPNGDYTVRFKMVDFYGNASPSVAHDFNVNRPASLAMTTVPRVYNRDDVLQPGTTGIIRGRYIGLNVNVTDTMAATDGFHVADGEGGFIVIERKEYDRPEGEVDETPRIVSGRIRPDGTSGSSGAYRPTFPVLFTDSAGREVVFRDYTAERDVTYNYRVVAVNRFGNRTTSAWAPLPA